MDGSDGRRNKVPAPGEDETQEGSASDLSVRAGGDDALSEDAARRLTERINLLLDTAANSIEKAVALIAEARDGDAHQALGYPQWTAYVAAEFGDALGRLTRIERQPVVRELAEMGMSTRAIGSVVGASKSTVARDLGESGVPHGTPAEPGTITGTDGKTYPRPEPRKPRRRPLPDQYWDAVYELEKVIGRLARLHADDRYGANREAIRDHFAGHMGELVDWLDDVESDLRGHLHCHECGIRRLPRLNDESTCERCRGSE